MLVASPFCRLFFTSTIIVSPSQTLEKVIVYSSLLLCNNQRMNVFRENMFSGMVPEGDNSLGTRKIAFFSND